MAIRPDYGSAWDGNFILKNNTHISGTGNPNIILLGNNGWWDFGYVCSLPKNIYIDGFHVINSGTRGTINLTHQSHSPLPVIAEDNVHLQPFPYIVEETTIYIRNASANNGSVFNNSANPYMNSVITQITSWDDNDLPWLFE